MLKALLCLLEVAARLHVEKKLRSPTGQPSKPQCHLGVYRRIAVQDSIELGKRYLHTPSGLGGRQFDVIIEYFAHKRAGVDRWPLQRATDWIFPSLDCGTWCGERQRFAPQ